MPRIVPRFSPGNSLTKPIFVKGLSRLILVLVEKIGLNYIFCVLLESHVSSVKDYEGVQYCKSNASKYSARRYASSVPLTVDENSFKSQQLGPNFVTLAAELYLSRQ